MRQTFEEKLTEIIRPEVEGIGCQLWGLTSLNKGTKRVIRIYIDSPEGATIDQCARVSRMVGLTLDVEEIIPGAFVLEVSSPGLDRRFFSTEQMRDYVGRKVNVVLNETTESRRKFSGELKSVSSKTFTVSVGNEDITFPWMEVKSVRLIHEF